MTSRVISTRSAGQKERSIRGHEAPTMTSRDRVPGGNHVTIAKREGATKLRDGRGWAWAALVSALVVWVAGVPTAGLSVVLAPVTLLLSLVAWRRSRPDVVFLIGLALNGLLVLALIAEIVAVLTGEASVGWE
jgi:hypothetical protein